MLNVLGVSDSLVLFQSGDKGTVVDTKANLVVQVGNAESLYASREWQPSTEEIRKSVFDLAQGAIADLDIKVIVASGRLYTIPRGVQAEAKKALEWRKEHKRGGTPVGLNTARTLSKGGQIGIEKVRHIAKYFPRHEIDKKAKGWEPGEKGFPSRGRIAWALWGGDAGWRWAQAIVERENKKALSAEGYALPGYEPDFSEYNYAFSYSSDVSSFKEAIEKSEVIAPEFIARVRLDGSGIDRLYKIEYDNSTFVWDGSGWDDLGENGLNIWDYDRALDFMQDDVDKTHVTIDPQSAVILSAHLQQNPETPVSIEQIDQFEAHLLADALGEIDWEEIDRAMIAAGEVAGSDGQYTPEERSKNAARQVRDASGRFASQGSRVVVGGDIQGGVGYIRAINPDSGTVKVEFDNGTTADVPANTTEKVAKYVGALARETVDTPPFDTSGILGQPRTPIDRPQVQIPGTLPALQPKDWNEIVNNWPAWVKSQRDQFKPLNSPGANLKTDSNPTQTPTSPATPTSTRPGTPSKAPAGATPLDKAPTPDISGSKASDVLKMTGAKLTLDAYDHPLLAKWLNKSVKNKKTGEVTYPNRLWYQPVTSAGAPVELTPDNSDVQPLFMAIVSPDDPRAVMDLVALVPASSTSNAPMTYKRVEKEWRRDEGILADLNSATPPPVVPLDSETLQSVLEQVDTGAIVAAIFDIDRTLAVLWGPIIAAGGADRNRGNAEKLRRYWTVGKGGQIKIRWNSPGDWTRCYRNLKKYMGVRAKGYCSLRHKEMTGMWPGDRQNRELAYRTPDGNVYSTDLLLSSDEIIEAASLTARANDARARLGLAASAHDGYGAKFSIPLVIPEDMESGDGRKFRKGAIDMRELPLPLMWQIKTGEGHMGSVVVGRIDHMERTDQGIGNAYGVFDTGAYGKEAERLVRNGFIKGVSADMDKFEAKEELAESGEDTEGKVGGGKIDITKARVMGVTIVPKPAFQECKIFIIEDETEEQEEDSVIPDGVYVEDVDPAEAASLVACGFVAGAIPVTPPKDWFTDPKLTKPTPLTVDDTGRVFGHIAAWHVDHIGLSYGTKPPRSKSKYAYFHTGVVRTEDGTDVPVGQLTLAGGHAPLEASARDAARHYDDTASAIADVHAGEDAFGIWVAGSLRPGASPEQVRALRASAPSGDWRPIKGSLELVAVCQVNVPGFPIARARVASGQVMALVAAGASTLARLKSDPVAELQARVAKLEQLENAELSTKADAAKARFAEVREARRAELQSRIAELSSRVLPTEDFEDGFGYISREERQKLAKKGYALPDGSYPITNVESLKDSIQAYGRGKPSKRAAIRRHIMKRARVLGKPELIPDKWKAMSSEEIELSVNELRSRIPAAITAGMGADCGMCKEYGCICPAANGAECMCNQACSCGMCHTAASVECGMCKEYGCICPGCVGQGCGCMQGCTCQKCHSEVEMVKYYSTEENNTLGKALAVEPVPSEAKYVSGKTQPRDAKGKFRTVLARLKQDLGESGLQDVVEKVAEAENLGNAGNYVEAARSATDLLGIVDRIDSKALNPESLENVRSSARQLGETIANLPLPFGEENAKVRFSDLPPALKDLVDSMITRVEAKIGKKDADEATANLRSFMSGGDVYNQSEISSELSKLLRLLT